jgi:hypothetical protein
MRPLTLDEAAEALLGRAAACFEQFRAEHDGQSHCYATERGGQRCESFTR